MSDPRTLAVAGLLVVLLAVGARLLYASSHPRPRPPLRTAALGVAAVGAVWVLANTRLEGDILFSLTRRHGVTESDIPAAVLFVVAAAMMLWSWRPRERGPDDDVPTGPGPLSPRRRPSRRRAS